MSRAFIAVCLGLGGCTWVSSKDIDERLPQLDDDQDGVVAADDCDDKNDAIFPGAQDDWYDGVDSDCAGNDDFDQDGDGIGVELDCDDTDATAVPDAVDTWYDGLDSDCAGDDDFDQDGDGYVPAEYAGMATAGVDGSGQLPGGDCDDTDLGVNPGATDAWYDGVDSDCGGEDDFDQDGDGFVQDADAGKATLYVDGSGALPGGECDDTNPSAYPGADETWYNDTDEDCGGDDDFDQDGDGQASLEQGMGADCDDLDAEVYDGALEVLGDGVDRDCDGGEASFFFDDLNTGDDFTIDTPIDLRLKANSTRLFLSFAAREASSVEVGSDTTYYNSAIALLYELSALHDAPEARIEPWVATTTLTAATATGGHDILVTDYALIGAMGLTSTSRTFRLGGYDVAADDIEGQSYAVTGLTSPLSSVTLARDGEGDIHFIGCSEDGTMMYFWMDMEDCDAAGDLSCWGPENQSRVQGFAASSCVAEFHTDASVGRLHASQESGYTIARFAIDSSGSYTYDDDEEMTEVSNEDAYLPTSLVLAEDSGGDLYRVFYDEASGQILALDEDDAEIVIDSSVSDATPVRAAFGPDDRLYVAYLEDDVATLTYGTIRSATFTGATTTLPVDGFTPDQVEVWAGDAAGSGETDLAVAIGGASEVVLGFARVAP